ncbi:MAG: nucleoside kinase [Clostridia bacterium]
MRITIDGIICRIKHGESVKAVLDANNLSIGTLSSRPLACKVGGEVHSLNYHPAENAAITLLRYGSDSGKRVYERSIKFIFLLACKLLFPSARVLEEYSIGNGVFFAIENREPPNIDDARLVEKKCRQLIEKKLIFKKIKVSLKDAVENSITTGQIDKTNLLKWRSVDFFKLYYFDEYPDFKDYFYGETVLDTGYTDVFSIEAYDGGFVLMEPDKNNPEIPAKFVREDKLATVFRQGNRWAEILKCSNVAELNELVKSGKICELIRVNEALHEKNFALLADSIVKNGARAVMVAGPSSSGKTTSAHRLLTQLRVNDLSPVLISLDNYYRDRNKIALDENGEIDLENIDALNIERFNDDLFSLISGKPTALPLFNFLTGKSEETGKTITLYSNQPVIIEGIHALNPKMISNAIDKSTVYRVYVNALTTLNLDDHNMIRTSDVRLLRRLVRDYKTRSASMEHTFSMWDSVKRGEEIWITPFREEADTFLNTILVYEISILKKYVYPLLSEVMPNSAYYAPARELIKFLNYFLSSDADAEIPPTSILREFIGGNSFYRD